MKSNIYCEEQWVTFYLGGELYAYKVASVREVITYRQPVPVPGATINIEGVLNVRGEIIHVIAGGEFVGSHTSNACDRIIIVETRYGTIGISAGSVGEIINIKNESIESDAHYNPGILGTVVHKDHLIILIEIIIPQLEQAA